MSSSNARDSPETGSADLTGVCILVVEDSWHIGIAMKNLLSALGADVAGPAATTAEAERLISEQMPDAAVVDFNLRGGELAHGLIDRLNDRGIRVIVVSGYAVVPLAPGKAAAILQKPIVEAQLLAALRPVTARKAAQRGILP
jgi:DNA-binding NtrC family response regulator